MGRTVDHSFATTQECLKLKVALVQTANDVHKCLKTLKANLGKYDRRHGCYFRSSSKYFMRSDVRVAKELATDLRYVAKRMSRTTNPTTSEINAARMSMDAITDAMNDLIQSGRIYDQNNGQASDVTSIMDHILSGNDCHEKKKNEGGVFQSGNGKSMTKRGLFGHQFIGRDMFQTRDTVEAVVAWTLRESFGGVATLKQQLMATENAMSPM